MSKQVEKIFVIIKKTSVLNAYSLPASDIDYLFEVNEGDTTIRISKDYIAEISEKIVDAISIINRLNLKKEPVKRSIPKLIQQNPMDDSSIELKLLVHTSDFLGESKTHFDVLKDKNENDIDIESEFKKQFSSSNNIIKETTLFWFKSEPRSCTVFKPLDKALNDYKSNNNEESLKGALTEIVNFHDSERRRKIREGLFQNMNGDKEKLDNYIQEALKFNV